jgi:hypothetical protein
MPIEIEGGVGGTWTIALADGTDETHSGWWWIGAAGSLIFTSEFADMVLPEAQRTPDLAFAPGAWLRVELLHG